MAAEAAAFAGPRLQLPSRKRGAKGARVGRMGLSVRERRTAALGMAAASGWVTVVDATALSWRLDAALLAAVLGVPATKWWTSRRRPAPKLSPATAALLEKWGTAVAGPGGPKQLQGSAPVASSVSEPVDGAVAMVVQLVGVHAADATSTRLRRDVEVALGLPADTVRLTALRDEGSADRLAVTMTPSRHLEAASTTWPGPVLGADGAIPVALDPAGKTISVHLHNEDGVEHGLISGGAGMGKGGSTVVVIPPGPLAGVEVVLYVDGKAGMSAPELEPVIDKMAVTPEQWGRLVDIAHAVMCEREQRYGALRLKRFVVGRTPDEKDPDPVLTLLIDEATTVNGALSARRLRKVAEIAQRGRAIGVRLIQVSQSVRADMIVGGVPTRDLLTGSGFSIAHKPGGSSAARLATDGIAVPGLVEALQSLPPNKPGFAVISRRGEVLAAQARVFDAEDDAIAAMQAWKDGGGVLRHLTGADLKAAGPVYVDWTTTTAAEADGGGAAAGDGAASEAASEAGSGAGEAGKGDTVGQWIVAALDKYGPQPVAALQEMDGAPARATLYRTVNRLQAAELIVNRAGTFHLLDHRDDPDTAAEVAADDEAAREQDDELAGRR